MMKKEELSLLFEAKKDYFYFKLGELLSQLGNELAKAHKQLESDPTIKVVVINGQEVSITQFAILLGNFFIGKKDLKNWSFWASDKDEIKKTFVQRETFLKEFPGVILPPRPELVDKWLKER